MKSKLFVLLSTLMVVSLQASEHDSRLDNLGEGNGNAATYAFRRIQSKKTVNDEMTPAEIAMFIATKPQKLFSSSIVDARQSPLDTTKMSTKSVSFDNSNNLDDLEVQLPIVQINSPVHGEKDAVITPASVAIDYSPVHVSNDVPFQPIAEQTADQVRSDIARIFIGIRNDNIDKSDEISRGLTKLATTRLNLLNLEMRMNTPTYIALQEQHKKLLSRADAPVDKINRLQARIDYLKFGK